MITLCSLLIAVLLTALTIPLLQRLAIRYQLVDMPDERKVHRQPIPRVGGVAMALGAFVPLVLLWSHEPFVVAYLVSAGVIVVFGMMDDLRDLAPRWKFLGQGIAAALIMVVGEVRIVTLGTLLPGGVELPAWLGVMLTLVAIVGVTNAINLADGLDGLAGGISILSLAIIGYLAWLEGNTAVGLIALVVCGAIFGFLRYNSFPASVFMGDTGSQLLGFTAVSLALKLTQCGSALSPVVPLVILGFPVLDTLTVMSGRIMRGRSPFSADKTHFHHSLLALGLHQTESVLTIYLIQISLVLAAYSLRFHSDWLLLVGYLSFSGGVLALFGVTRRQGWEPKRTHALVRSKAWLRLVRERTATIVYIFRSVQLLYPALLALSVLGAARPSLGVALGALGTLVLLLGVERLLPERLEDLLRGVLYLLVPYLVYRTEVWLAAAPPLLGHGYTSLVALLALLALLVTKLTRRREGFSSSPLDFLIMFLAVLAPNLPAAGAEEFRFGLVGARVIILYYGCEVLLAELRGRCVFVARAVAVVLGLLALRRFF